MTPSKEDRTLVEECLSGDSRAWARLLDVHYAAAARFVAGMSSDFSREDIEEICQETFLSVVRYLPQYRRESLLQTWIFRIAANKSRDYRERRNAMKRGGGHQDIPLDPTGTDGAAPVDPPDAQAGPADVVMSREDCSQVRNALDILGDPCREILELRYFADLPYEEISSTLNLNIKTVSSRLSKCLDKLESILRSHFPDFSV